MKEKKERYQIELPLMTEPFQEAKLNKILMVSCRLYNQMLAKNKAKYREMTKTKEWREIGAELKELYETGSEQFKAENEKRIASGKKALAKRTLSDREKELYQRKNEILRENGFSEFGMSTQALRMSKPWVKLIDSTMAQNIGVRQWRAWDTIIFQHRGESVHFCKSADFNSVEGKNNKTGLRIKRDVVSKHRAGILPFALTYKDMIIPIKVDADNYYEMTALNDEICYTRVVKRIIKGKTRFFAQIVLKGNPPFKLNEDGELKYPIGKGKCLINIGVKNIEVHAGQNKYELALDDYKDVKAEELLSEREKELTAYMERSRRASNPNNYNPDGTIKKQGNKKVYWTYSNRYKVAKAELQEIRRKKAYKNKHEHFALANILIQEGDEFIIRMPDFKYLQQRDNPSMDEDGKYKKTKKAGEEIKNNAPAMFVSIFTNKVKQQGGSVKTIKSSAVTIEDFFKVA